MVVFAAIVVFLVIVVIVVTVVIVVIVMALIVSWLQGTDRQCQLLGTGQLKTLSGPFSRLGSGMVTTLPGDDAIYRVLNT